jgi:hypothetical protein
MRNVLITLPVSQLLKNNNKKKLKDSTSISFKFIITSLFGKNIHGNWYRKPLHTSTYYFTV